MNTINLFISNELYKFHELFELYELCYAQQFVYSLNPLLNYL